MLFMCIAPAGLYSWCFLSDLLFLLSAGSVSLKFVCCFSACRVLSRKEKNEMIGVSCVVP